MTTIYVTSLKVVKDARNFFICFKEISSIQLFLFRKMQYFEFLSLCVIIRKINLVLSEIFLDKILSCLEHHRYEKLTYASMHFQEP